MKQVSLCCVLLSDIGINECLYCKENVMKFNEYTLQWFVGKMAAKGFEEYVINTSVDRGQQEALFILEVMERIKRIEDDSIAAAGSQEKINQEMNDIVNAR